jgi:hypothetical protein
LFPRFREWRSVSSSPYILLSSFHFHSQRRFFLIVFKHYRNIILNMNRLCSLNSSSLRLNTRCYLPSLPTAWCWRWKSIYRAKTRPFWLRNW